MKRGFLAQPAIEKLEVEQDQDVLERGRQAGDVGPCRIGVAELEDVADHELDLFEPTRQRMAKGICVLPVGLGDRLGLEEQVDAPLARLHQQVGVHCYTSLSAPSSLTYRPVRPGS
jgi:hypothetical protein